MDEETASEMGEMWPNSWFEHITNEKSLDK